MMEPQQVFSILREHASALRERGVEHLHVFGSVARNEATPQSDVDILIDFKPDKQLTLVSLGSLEFFLSSMLNSKVDITASKWMREPVRKRALEEAVLVF